MTFVDHKHSQGCLNILFLYFLIGRNNCSGVFSKNLLMNEIRGLGILSLWKAQGTRQGYQHTICPWGKLHKFFHPEPSLRSLHAMTVTVRPAEHQLFDLTGHWLTHLHTIQTYGCNTCYIQCWCIKSIRFAGSLYYWTLEQTALTWISVNEPYGAMKFERWSRK
jgi:hypothetical protein